MGLFRCVFAVLAGSFALAGAVGCSHAPAPPAVATPTPAPAPLPPCTTPEPLRFSLQATPQLNLGEKGEALAVVVRLYQLKGTGKLQGAGIDDLVDRDKEVLGDELLATTEVTITPGERLDPFIPRNPEAAHLAAVALFRRPVGNTWRALARLPPADPQHCHAAAKAKSTSGAKQTPPAAPPSWSAAPPSSPRPLRFLLDENRIDLR